MEYLRELKVTIEIDTNKRGNSVCLELEEHETMDEFLERVKSEIEAETDDL